MRSRFDGGGFTVAELLGLLLVTSILVGIVVSGYITHSIRRQVTEALTSAEFLQLAVERAFHVTGEVPAELATVGQPSRPSASLGIYVKAIEVTNGRIDLTFGNEADPAIAGRRLSLTPYESATQDITWICGNRIPPVGLQPLGFAVGGPSAVQPATTVKARYLPRSCR